MNGIRHQACCCLSAGAPGSASDIIAVYSPAVQNIDPTQTLFIKYITGSQITGYVGKGSGTYV